MLILALLLLTPRSLFAQGSSRDSTRADTIVYDETNLRATLQRWAARQRLYVLDRSHVFDNRQYDRGTFRHIMPGMDKEYHLDRFTYGFTLAEDNRWNQATGGFRTKFGSVRRDLWAIRSEIRHTLSLGESVTFDVEAVLQEDPTTQRAVVELSPRWQITSRHAVGVRHTFGQAKYDVDFTLFYAFSDPQWGTVRTSVTRIDVYNDAIYEHLGVQPIQRDVIRTYSRNSPLLALSYRTPVHSRLHVEVVGGLQPRSRSHFQSQTDPRYRYRNDRRVHYAGALTEYDLSDTATAGILYQRNASWLRRATEGDSLSTHYTSEQTFQQLGVFAIYAWRGLRAELWGFVGDYSDRQTGSSFEMSTISRPVDYQTDRLSSKIRVTYEPEGRPYVGLEYDALIRNFGPNPRVLSESWSRKHFDTDPDHHRLVGLFGYRFARGSVAVGVGLDLDGDTNSAYPRFKEPHSYFDNAFGRLTFVW